MEEYSSSTQDLVIHGVAKSIARQIRQLTVSACGGYVDLHRLTSISTALSPSVITSRYDETYSK